MSQVDLWGSSVGVATPEAREAHDAYYTPDLVADALVERLTRPSGHDWIGRQTRVLEPHAGGGAFVRALRRRGCTVDAHDIDPGAPACETRGDFLALKATEAAWIVGNPPFCDAEAHVRHALCLCPRVAFLLRLGFLASAVRATMWAGHPPAAVYVLSERPSFTADGATDSADYCFVVWAPHHGPTRMEWVSWRAHRVTTCA
jgi:hypothetical protein